MAATSTKIKTEDVLDEKLDRCFVDFGNKMASGFAVGKEIIYIIKLV